MFGLRVGDSQLTFVEAVRVTGKPVDEITTTWDGGAAPVSETLNVRLGGLAFRIVDALAPVTTIVSVTGALWQEVFPTIIVKEYVPGVVGVPEMVLF